VLRVWDNAYQPTINKEELYKNEDNSYSKSEFRKIA
jgi:hypothetical protein